MKKYILLLFFINFYFNSNAQDNADKHPIERKFQNCIEKNGTTIGMIECTEIATKNWDNEMNTKYKQLIQILRPQEIEKLKLSQRNWISFRDSELSFSNLFLSSFDGTESGLNAVSKKMTLTQNRALEIIFFYSEASNR
jgi:uncharacterized protein YecT (DUF1311 family)